MTTEQAEAPRKTMSVADLIEKYVKIRARREERKKAYDDADKADKGVQDQMEGVLLRFFEQTGQDSAKTPAGTAYTTKQTSVSLADPDIFFDWVRTNEAWDLADIRAAKKNIEQYQLDNGGKLPPGVNYRSQLVVNVRRPA